MERIAAVVNDDPVSFEGIVPHVVPLAPHVDVAIKPEQDTLITVRGLLSEDVEELRDLHEEWFPIRYNQVQNEVV